MASLQWKNASTLMLMARNQLGQSVQGTHSLFGQQYRYDYSCMLLKRSAKSKFFAKAFVFPGGATESADFAPSWLEHFAQSGFDKERLASHFVVAHQSRIPLYAQTLADGCLPEIGYRISAIRETFEETGVLLCKPVGRSEPVGDLSHWQERVYRNPEEFLTLCRQHGLCPDVWSLHEWANWLTPEHMGPKRYDTIFYLCVVDQIPQVRIDGQEITEIRWLDPMKAVWEHVQGNIWLAPPQIYELSRLAHFGSVDDLKVFAGDRERRGITRWLPVGLKTPGGFSTLLPGDALYPGNETAIVNKEASGSQTESSRNRMEFASPTKCRIVCNVHDPHGHKSPVNLVDMMEEVLSKSQKSKL